MQHVIVSMILSVAAKAEPIGHLRMKGTHTGSNGINLRIASQNHQKSPLDSYMSPIDLSILPQIKPPLKKCRVQIIDHIFANSYGNPSQSNYFPPMECISQGTIAKAILNYKNQVKGAQFDRFGAIYIDQSEILRTTTAEPTQEGIAWSFEKDISQIIPLLYARRNVTHILGNTIDSTYTGSFHVAASIDLFVEPKTPRSNHTLIPISRDDKEPWYEINSANPISHAVQVPPHPLERAELEVFISGHSCDEFTYINTPTEHAHLNNECEMGPYRELEVYIDDYFVGSVMPYPVIYTGGLSYSQWRPISGMGSFDLPTKVMDLSSYLALLEGGTHTFKFHMKDATSMWFVSANLHLFTSNNPPKRMLGYPLQRGTPDTVVIKEAEDRFKTLVKSEISTLSVQDFGDLVILTRVDNAIDFIHTISYGQSRAFELNCTSKSTTTTYLLNSKPEMLDTLWGLAQPPITKLTRSETYRLAGTYFLTDTLRKLTISLHSLTSAEGITGGINPIGDSITELNLSGTSYVDQTTPIKADNFIRAAVRHRSDRTSDPRQCYSRDLTAAHGDFTTDRAGSVCPPNSI